MNRLAKKRIRVFPGRNEGQSLLLIALLLPVILIFAAFAVDGAHAFADYRHLQNTADASALAAAQDINSPLCTGPTWKCVQNEATDYANQNGEWPNTHGVGHDIPQCPVDPAGVALPPSDADPNTLNCYQYAYVTRNSDGTVTSHPDKVLVRLHDCTALWIGKFIGAPPICYSVRSVALATPLTGTTITPPSSTIIPDITSTITNTSTTVVSGTTSTITSYTTTTIPATTTTIPASTTTIPGSATTGPDTTVTSVSTVSVPSGGVGFAKSAVCPAIKFTGQGGGKISGLETNGGVRTNNEIDGLEAGLYNTCLDTTGGGVIKNGSQLTPNPVDWPIPIPIPPSAPPTAPNTCSSLGNSGDVTFTLAAHPTQGVYCLGGSGTLTIAASGNYSGYTFVAANISVSAPSSTFSPAAGENVVFSTQSIGGLSITGSNPKISGMMCLGTSGGTMQETASLPPGAYCLLGTSGQLGLNGTNWTGYSFYAPSIKVSTSHQFFCPSTSHADNSLDPPYVCDDPSGTLFDAYVGDLSLSGNTNSASGNMFAPNGQASVAGGSVGAGSGYIEAQTLSFTGNFSSFHGTGGGGGGTVTVTSTTPGTTGTTPPTTSTTPGTTITTPGTTSTITNTSTSVGPGTTSTSTSTTTTVIQGTTISTPGTTQTSTTGTNVGLGE
jgi:hypothetical protein